MADKISTIVLKVDLECERCYKKIRRVLCKIQDSMNIKTISFDEKSNAVTISGPFDAEKVCKKLCCKAGRIIKEMDIKDKAKGGDKPKDGGGDKPKAAAKPAEGKPEKPKEGKAEKDGAAKGEKKDDKAEKKDGKGEKEAKPDKGGNDGKAEKKVKFADGADAKPGKAMAMPPADLGPLLEKMMAAKAGQEPPRGEPKPMAAPPAMVPGAAQGVAVPSIWPAPAGSVSGYGYNPGYDAPAYYGGGGGGYGAYGCGCGGYNGYCRCGKPAAPSGYYGVPVYDNQGWYYGGGGAGAGARQPYYQQQCCEDPNAGCSVM